eukprot:Nk52_evm25s243 gene=Nk52_evmTU25s243
MLVNIFEQALGAVIVTRNDPPPTAEAVDGGVVVNSLSLCELSRKTSSKDRDNNKGGRRRLGRKSIEASGCEAFKREKEFILNQENNKNQENMDENGDLKTGEGKKVKKTGSEDGEVVVGVERVASEETMTKSAQAKLYLESHLLHCAQTSPQERLRRRRKLGSWMPEEALAKMREDVQNICSRPLGKLTVGADLPRLIKNMTVRVGQRQIFPSGRDSCVMEHVHIDDSIDTSSQLFKQTSCDDLTVFPSDTDLNEKVKGLNIPNIDVTSSNYIIPVLKHFLMKLSETVDLDDHFKTLEKGVEKYLHNEGETDRASVALDLKALLKDEAYASDNHRSCRILKACNQASIAPFVSSLKMGLGSTLHFNSVRNSWKIQITINPSSILVTHDMAEKITDIDTGDIVCTFYWQVRILFDPDVATVKVAEFDISRVHFSSETSEEEENTMLQIFKSYGYQPAKTSNAPRSMSEGQLMNRNGSSPDRTGNGAAGNSSTSPKRGSSGEVVRKRRALFKRFFTDPSIGSE